MTKPRHAKTIILGSGPAGYTAAIYAARAMLKPLLIQGSQPGGQLTITTDVENYPGFADVIQGPWLMEQMQAQAAHVGTDIVMDHISKVDLRARPIRLEGESGDAYTADTLIICTGAQARWLGLPSEETFKGYGVSACATCDGFFYKGKEVLVVGGGNTAVEEAMFLTNFASKVTVAHRRDHFRAEKILQQRLFANPKIEVVWDTVVEEIVGHSRAESGHRREAQKRQDRQSDGTRDRRRVRRYRPCAGNRVVQGTARHDAVRLPHYGAGFDRNVDSWRLRGWRCEGRNFPSGGHRGRHGLHGGARSGEVSREARGDGSRRGIDRGAPRPAPPVARPTRSCRRSADPFSYVGCRRFSSVHRTRGRPRPGPAT